MKKEMRTTVLIISLLLTLSASSQGTVIGMDPNAVADPSALLDLRGTFAGSPVGGLLVPRMSQAQRGALTGTAAEGLWVYQTDNLKGYYVYDGSKWIRSASTRSLTGRVNVNGATGVQTGTVGTGFTAVQNGSDPGQFDITYTPTIFSNPPSVILTSSSLDPVTTITPAIYCAPTFSAACNTSFNADYLDDVRIQSCPTGGASCNYGPDGFIDDNTGCDAPGNNNYQDNFNDPTLLATLYGPNFSGSAFFNMYLRSSWEWRDNLFAYIDWNQDGDFEDASEVVVEFYFPSGAPSSQGAPNGANFSLDEIIGDCAGYDAGSCHNPLNVPGFAANGVTVLRVMSRWQATVPDPCIATTFGETHDYKVLVVGGDPGASAGPRSTLCTVGNVTTTGFRVFCTDMNNNRTGSGFHFYSVEN